ncbi:hypothetical protein [Rhizorhapis sp. SPR117]|uniref:hypothetical protein n=1 Tax=Rhizorhapis sp. SPR117 TaxID=2912611 RepID=UPI001F3F0749|nr:hypothetical protein [Rhizorhapis sp. SPR117]
MPEKAELMVDPLAAYEVRGGLGVDGDDRAGIGAVVCRGLGRRLFGGRGDVEAP